VRIDNVFNNMHMEEGKAQGAKLSMEFDNIGIVAIIVMESTRTTSPCPLLPRIPKLNPS
jgi:hypothetical protein